MKIESLILLGVGAFFAVVGLIYWFVSYEPTGTMLLVGTALLGVLPGGYYFFWYRRMGPRPEDRDDATMEEGAGVIDSFPSTSIWPFIFGVGAFVGLLAFAFGTWLAVPGALVILIAIIGYTAESRRGGTV